MAPLVVPVPGGSLGYRVPVAAPGVVTAAVARLTSQPMADLLRTPNDGPSRLRALLAGDQPVLLPGCYDALGARLIERAGFDAVYMTGFGSSAGPSKS